VGYDFVPRNKAAGGFYLGAFSFPVALQACNYLWPAVFGAVEFYALNDPCWGTKDPSSCPPIMTNDGFYVSAEEARIMARLIKNFVRIQKCALKEQTQASKQADGPITQDDTAVRKWPLVVTRTDFLDKFGAFSEWLVKSRGFWIH